MKDERKTPKVYHSADLVWPVAHEVRLALGPKVKRIQIAGSLRRACDKVADVDLVAVPKEAREITLQAFCSLCETIVRRGNYVATGLIGGIQVDLWLVEPDQFGAAVMFATGPAELNILQRQHAIRMGLKLSQYGLFTRDGTDLSVRGEKRIYRKLGLKYLKPQEREAYRNGGKYHLPKLGEEHVRRS